MPELNISLLVVDYMSVSKEHILSMLDEVKDPEIPVLSLVDLGVITQVDIQGEKVLIEMTPTFVGCPAMDMMKSEVLQKLKDHGITSAEVYITFKQPWSSDRISEKGKQALKKFGIAPPLPSSLFTDIDVLEQVACPRCHGTDTELRNPFGPTLCRSIHYCNTCREAFEQFKPIS
jgi:ring-1,2-phenylacetyl-CoA epoxidase subunit PaaD